jgi:peptidoglycan/LPS O-acetylase OafA/YrhL
MNPYETVMEQARANPINEFNFRSPLLKREMPGLNALRGLAILSVIFYHGLYWNVVQKPPLHSLAAHISDIFIFGWLGVFLFFILSGFLISGILLDSKIKPFYWRNFYVRRILRILPAFVVVLLIVKIIFHATWLYFAICLANMANLAPMLHLAGVQDAVFWSLAVEEQFYLIWPCLVKYLTRFYLIYVALALVIFSPVLRYLSAANIIPLGDVHTMTWLISDNFAAGSLLALLLRSPQFTVLKIWKISWALFIMGILLLAAGIPFGILHRTNLLGASCQTVPFELIFSSFLLFALLIGDRRDVVAWTRPLQFFGYISFGLYLSYDLVFAFLDHIMRNFGCYQIWSARDWILRFVGESSLSVFVAYLSRRYFEEYFLRLKKTII